VEHLDAIAAVACETGVETVAASKGSGKGVFVGLSNVDSNAQDDFVVGAKEPMH